jgi:hypothetical protein
MSSVPGNRSIRLSMISPTASRRDDSNTLLECQGERKARRPSSVWITRVRLLESLPPIGQWLVPLVRRPINNERRLITLLARLDTDNQSIQDLFVLPLVDRPKVFWIQRDDKWLERGLRLVSLRNFLEVVEEIRKRRTHR